MVLSSLWHVRSRLESQLKGPSGGISFLDFDFSLLLGFGVMKVGFPGISPFSIESTAFSNPEIPAAGSECPRLLLIYEGVVNQYETTRS